jgi:hypothetical protein
MSKNKFSAAAKSFKGQLSENSPLEAPIRGFSRYARDMSPSTRELVLRSRMPEIMAFAEDRRLDPAVVAGAVEASLRLGRVPDLGLYGLAGDEALAVKDFIAQAMFGLEWELKNNSLPQLTESSDKATKHKSYADHYRNLANHHTKAMDFHTQAAKQANSEGRPFTAAKHQGKIVMLKQLHMSHASLADYHDCEAERCAKAAQRAAVPEGAGPVNVDQPTSQPQITAHPAQGATAAQRQEVPSNQRQEATTAAALAPIMKPIGSAFLRRSPIKSVAIHKSKQHQDDAVEFRKEQIQNEQRRTRRMSRSTDGFFQKMVLIDDMLSEADKSEKKDKKDKKDKKKSKTPSKKELGIKEDPDKIDKTIANVKVASLFHQLGHKMDHAYAQLKDHEVKDKWATKLHKTCLSKGGPACFHEVVEASLSEPWIRDQGFVDEAANLNHLWQTMMSAETETTVSRASPTNPEPLVFTINRMIDISQGRGSIY